MSDVSAEKKPPERLCPRGAKDTHFSGSDWTLHGRALGQGTLVPRAAARRPV